MGYDVYSLIKIQRDLRAFSEFIRSLDSAVQTVSLQPGDRSSLRAAVGAIERFIDEHARRPPLHPETHAIAKDLKESRGAALRLRFDRLT